MQAAKCRTRQREETWAQHGHCAPLKLCSEGWREEYVGREAGLAPCTQLQEARGVFLCLCG